MTEFEIRYPDVTVQLTGTDGNVFAVIGTVARAIRREHGNTAADEFTRLAHSQDSYDAVLRLCLRTVNVE